RSRVYAWAHVVGVTGALAVLVLPSLITTVGGKDQAAGVAAMGWFIVLAAPATILIAALGTPERLTPKPRAPVNWREVVGLFRRPSMLRLIACDFALSFGPGFTAP
ncbi:MFS transporter, partial [Escherichia coli]|uniref:MFS transporter n=1 Tax=Escherichia coli TaxID=562 RepID=UPI0028DF39AD